MRTACCIGCSHEGTGRERPVPLTVQCNVEDVQSVIEVGPEFPARHRILQVSIVAAMIYCTMVSINTLVSDAAKPWSAPARRTRSNCTQTGNGTRV